MRSWEVSMSKKGNQESRSEVVQGHEGEQWASEPNVIQRDNLQPDNCSVRRSYQVPLEDRVFCAAL